MPKLTLDLDEIQVESFSTEPQSATRGTVNARQEGRETWGCTVSPQITCDPTCEDTCNCPAPSSLGTCLSCDVTCGGSTCGGSTCDTCMATCNYATGPERCCAY